MSGEKGDSIGTYSKLDLYNTKTKVIISSSSINLKNACKMFE
jgi:hypothetical protein